MERLTIVEPGFQILTPVHVIKTELMPLIEKAGRTCYKSEHQMRDGTDKDFVGRIIRSGHESVIEHSCITVKLIGSRAMSHQLVRHRLAAYSQESQRYCDYGKKGLQIIVPPSVGKLVPGPYVRKAKSFSPNQTDYFDCWQHEQLTASNEEEKESLFVWYDSNTALFEFLEVVNKSYKYYLHAREDKIPPEDARFILPNATKTEVVTTYNLRQWRHVFKERALNKHAQWEIRKIMLGILVAFSQMLPTVFMDLARGYLEGMPEEPAD